MSGPAAWFSVRGLSKRFGGLSAVQPVTFEVSQGMVFAIIGPNGAGKTTLFNCLAGIYPSDGGSVELEGRPIAGLPPHRISQAGVSRTFQNIRLFPEMTAMENVLVGMHARMRSNLAASILRTASMRREEDAATGKARDLLDRAGLSGREGELARNLPYGLQRRLEIARALATGPKLLLLDEPAAGMNPTESHDLMRLIGAIRDGGVTILLIEHDMRVVMGISDRILVLDHGERIGEGSPAEIQTDPRVIEAYLGKGAA